MNSTHRSPPRPGPAQSPSSPAQPQTSPKPLSPALSTDCNRCRDPAPPPPDPSPPSLKPLSAQTEEGHFFFELTVFLDPSDKPSCARLLGPYAAEILSFCLSCAKSAAQGVFCLQSVPSPPCDLRPRASGPSTSAFPRILCLACVRARAHCLPSDEQLRIARLRASANALSVMTAFAHTTGYLKVSTNHEEADYSEPSDSAFTSDTGGLALHPLEPASRCPKGPDLHKGLAVKGAPRTALRATAPTFLPSFRAELSDSRPKHHDTAFRAPTHAQPHSHPQPTPHSQSQLLIGPGPHATEDAQSQGQPRPPPHSVMRPMSVHSFLSLSDGSFEFGDALSDPEPPAAPVHAQFQAPPSSLLPSLPSALPSGSVEVSADPSLPYLHSPTATHVLHAHSASDLSVRGSGQSATQLPAQAPLPFGAASSVLSGVKPLSVVYDQPAVEVPAYPNPLGLSRAHSESKLHPSSYGADLSASVYPPNSTYPPAATAPDLVGPFPSSSYFSQSTDVSGPSAALRPLPLPALERWSPLGYTRSKSDGELASLASEPPSFSIDPHAPPPRPAPGHRNAYPDPRSQQSAQYTESPGSSSWLSGHPRCGPLTVEPPDPRQSHTAIGPAIGPARSHFAVGGRVQIQPIGPTDYDGGMGLPNLPSYTHQRRAPNQHANPPAYGSHSSQMAPVGQPELLFLSETRPGFPFPPQPQHQEQRQQIPPSIAAAYPMMESVRTVESAHRQRAPFGPPYAFQSLNIAPPSDPIGPRLRPALHVPAALLPPPGLGSMPTPASEPRMSFSEEDRATRSFTFDHAPAQLQPPRYPERSAAESTEEPSPHSQPRSRASLPGDGDGNAECSTFEGRVESSAPAGSTPISSPPSSAPSGSSPLHSRSAPLHAQSAHSSPSEQMLPLRAAPNSSPLALSKRPVGAEPLSLPPPALHQHGRRQSHNSIPPIAYRRPRRPSVSQPSPDDHSPRPAKPRTYGSIANGPRARRNADDVLKINHRQFYDEGDTNSEEMRHGFVFIALVVMSSVAHRLGLLPGDVILHFADIDEHTFSGDLMQLFRAVQRCGTRTFPIRLLRKISSFGAPLFKHVPGDSPRVRSRSPGSRTEEPPRPYPADRSHSRRGSSSASPRAVGEGIPVQGELTEAPEADTGAEEAEPLHEIGAESPRYEELTIEVAADRWAGGSVLVGDAPDE